ncbi:IS110 family transposase [Streptomyces sp. BE303]|uniref:IS110 family transposase n=1 Tax=Streptomyces sp. BE303 TaxID=3002528 RepID=UPI003FA6BE84
MPRGDPGGDGGYRARTGRCSSSSWRPGAWSVGWSTPVRSRTSPGRPRTDKLDAVWLAKLAERGMLRPSFVPPKPVRRLRDLTRTRTVLTEERSRHKP